MIAEAASPEHTGTGFWVAKLGSGIADARLTVNGEAMEGKIRFYWGAGTDAELTHWSVSGDLGKRSDGNVRMAWVRFRGSASTLSCIADADPHTGDGSGVCIDQRDSAFAWRFQGRSTASTPPPALSEHATNLVTLRKAKAEASEAPDDALVQIAYARAAWRAYQFDEAARTAQSVVGFVRNEPEALWILALYNYRHGRAKEALEFLERARTAGVKSQYVEDLRTQIAERQARSVGQAQPPTPSTPAPQAQPSALRSPDPPSLAAAKQPECSRLRSETRSCTVSASGPGGGCTISGRQSCGWDGEWADGCVGSCSYTRNWSESIKCCSTNSRYESKYNSWSGKIESVRVEYISASYCFASCRETIKLSNSSSLSTHIAADRSFFACSKPYNAC